MLVRSLGLTCALSLVTACQETVPRPDAVSFPDATVPVPAPLTLVTTSTVVTGVNHAIVLRNGAVVVQTKEGDALGNVLLLRGTADPRVLAAASDVGELRFAIDVGAEVLLGGTLGWVRTEGANVRISSLEQTLPVASVSRVVAVDGGVWMQRADDVVFWDGRTTRTLRTSPPLLPDTIAASARDACWGIANGQLVRMQVGSDVVARATLASDFVGVAVAAGVAYGVRADGSVWSGTAPANLSIVSEISRASRVLSTGIGVFVESSDGWFYAEQGATYRVSSPMGRVVSAGADSLIELDVEGAMMRRHAPRWDVAFVPHETDIVMPTVLSFTSSNPSPPSTVIARAAGLTLATDAAQSSVTVDPSDPEVANGSLDVEARVSWDDHTLPTTVHTTVQIAVSPTWSGTIEPLFQRRCASCHAGGSEACRGAMVPSSGTGRRLDCIEAWRAFEQLILTDIQTGRMPASGGRLSPADQARVESWIAGEFAP